MFQLGSLMVFVCELCTRWALLSSPTIWKEGLLFLIPFVWCDLLRFSSMDGKGCDAGRVLNHSWRHSGTVLLHRHPWLSNAPHHSYEKVSSACPYHAHENDFSFNSSWKSVTVLVMLFKTVIGFVNVASKNCFLPVIIFVRMECVSATRLVHSFKRVLWFSMADQACLLEVSDTEASVHQGAWRLTMGQFGGVFAVSAIDGRDHTVNLVVPIVDCQEELPYYPKVQAWSQVWLQKRIWESIMIWTR